MSKALRDYWFPILLSLHHSSNFYIQQFYHQINVYLAYFAFDYVLLLETNRIISFFSDLFCKLERSLFIKFSPDQLIIIKNLSNAPIIVGEEDI